MKYAQSLVLLTLSVLLFASCKRNKEIILPDTKALALHYFQDDADWYLNNIPFFECSDKKLEEVYYYRWKMYKAHIRNTGPDKFVITEFIDHVGWDREPFCTINAASMHHIYEGRWLRNPQYINGYINYLFLDGGNDRRYSESVADATYANYLVNGDKEFLYPLLDSMQSIYHAWNDHWDSTKQLYYIPAMPDATEFTIASIDASGGTGGFEGGEAFRPTINSYMYGNAKAIAAIAGLKGDQKVQTEFQKLATALRANILNYLWNDSLHHFTDRFKVDNKFVHYWDFIRGRELAGMVPWYFNVPNDSAKYSEEFKQVLDTSRLIGKFGFRTNEPSYQYYFKQYLYHLGQRGSQWNGPNWPYQNSQALTGIANALNDYQQSVIKPADYVHLLRLFALQHYLPNGKLNLVENYDPNLGGPIVYFQWSNHYNHSSFNNLIISGLCGVRPSDGDTLKLHPLLDDSISYFALKDLSYHGHSLTILYDKDGSHYNIDKGIVVLVDGKQVELIEKDGTYFIPVGPLMKNKIETLPANKALNLTAKGFPKPDASVNNNPDTLKQVLDGRVWYFPEIVNRWTSSGSKTTEDWFSVDFGKVQNINEIKIYPVVDSSQFFLPEKLIIEYQHENSWKPALPANNKDIILKPNTSVSVRISPVSTRMVRIRFVHSKGQVAFSEFECY